MKRILKVMLIIFSITYNVSPDVSLTGKTFRNGSNAAISGVKLALSKLNTLWATSDIDGNFSITETRLKHPAVLEPFSFKIKGNKIFFPSAKPKLHININAFSVSGKRLFSNTLNPQLSAINGIALPKLNSGIYIFNIDFNNRSYRYTATCLDNNLFFRYRSDANNEFQNSKVVSEAIAEDTITASKSGYITQKVAIDSYTKANLLIGLDSNATGQNKGLTIYFIRHAETVANASGETGGGGPLEDHDTLTLLGEKQVKELKNFLIKEQINPDQVIVSPSLRTQKTIDQFLSASNLKAEIWVELNECCGDTPTGEPIPTEKPDPRWKLKFNLLSDNFTYRNDEDIYYWWPQSYEEGLFMVMTARDRILERFSQSGKTIIIVGHAVNGGVLLGLMRGYDMLNEKPDRPVYLFNTGIVKLTQNTTNGEFTLKQNIYSPPKE